MNITIRSVPDEVRDELAARAARAGQSLQQYLTEKLTRMAESTDQEDWVRRARENAKRHPPISVDEILEAIHAERR